MLAIITTKVKKGKHKGVRKLLEAVGELKHCCGNGFMDRHLTPNASSCLHYISTASEVNYAFKSSRKQIEAEAGQREPHLE